MRVGMMQPYFFPYLGYFSLMQASDSWVVFDTAQYIRRGWVNRNRVLTFGSAPWKYIRVPVCHAPSKTQINQMRIDETQAWRESLLNSLDYYRVRKAPFFAHTIQFLEDTLSFESEWLIDVLTHTLQSCCRLLSISPRLQLASELGLPQDSHCGPGDWAFLTTQMLSGTTYINAPGGRALFDQMQFHQSGIELQFLDPLLPVYQQSSLEFQPGLSVIDVLMWNSTDTVREMIRQYELKAA